MEFFIIPFLISVVIYNYRITELDKEVRKLKKKIKGLQIQIDLGDK